MQRKKWNNLEWLEFDLLSDFPKVKHALFLRHGGCSQGPYASLNTGLHNGDKIEDVTANLSRIQEQLKFETPLWRNYAWGACQPRSFHRACSQPFSTRANRL